MGISLQARHPQDVCAFLPPSYYFQDFTGQAQKTLVSGAMRLWGLPPKGYKVLVPFDVIFRHAQDRELVERLRALSMSKGRSTISEQMVTWSGPLEIWRAKRDPHVQIYY